MDKTQAPCDCSTLTMLLNDPATGVKFIENYSFVLETEQGAYYFLHHCPGCGGKLPDPQKPVWYPKLDAVELTRLQNLIEGIKTGEDAEARLGKADFDAFMLQYDCISGGMPICVTSDVNFQEEGYVLNDANSYRTRNMEYHRLSEHADVQFYFGPDSNFRVDIFPKCLPPRNVTLGTE